MQRGPSLVLVLIAAATWIAPAGADIREGRLAARDLQAHYGPRHAKTEKARKNVAPACAWIASANPEEAALAKRLILFGLCSEDAQPADDAAPAEPGSTATGPAIIRGQGACSVVGKVGQSC